ncbi:MAG TPA: hypothetical protein DEP35_11335 [Deltaproteobacteria bacterium]|nr:hypothetical protein [Deltaproteobacteria bacterium]
MIRAMKRVYLLYTREKQDALVSRLQKLGLLHLEESRLDGAAAPVDRGGGDPAEARKQVENLLIKARGICDLLAEVHPAPTRAPAGEPLPTRLEDLYQRYRTALDPLEGRLKALVGERRELRDRLAAGERLAETVRVSEELLRSLPSEGYVFLPTVLAPGQQAALADVRRTLDQELPGQSALAERPLSGDRTELVVAVRPDFAPAVSEYLESKGIRSLALPPHVTGGFVDGIAQLKAETVTIPQRLSEIEKELGELAREHASRVFALTNALENRLAQLEAAAGFGYTDYALLISGWIPKDGFARFEETLRQEFPGIIVREEDVHGHDDAPVAFKEHPWARPYQLFMQSFGTPKAGTVDPIPYISLFFPVFFGLIVGDVGYGLIIVALALWGLRGLPGLNRPALQKAARSETGRYAMTIMLHGGLFSIILGGVFGEFFGLGIEQLGLHRWGFWPFSRVENTIGFLLVTIVLGAAQVTLGFLFGMITAARHGDRRHLAAKIGLFLSLVAFTLILGRLMNIVPARLLLPGIVILILALPLLIYGGGMMVILESLSPFVHVISYARIMGFGVASVILAELINSLAGGVSAIGGAVVGVILTVIVAVMFHTLNFVLDVYEGTIQSLRLHWVEFFEKFILEQLGGKPYRPFKEKEIAVNEP